MFFQTNSARVKHLVLSRCFDVGNWWCKQQAWSMCSSQIGCEFAVPSDFFWCLVFATELLSKCDSFSCWLEERRAGADASVHWEKTPKNASTSNVKLMNVKLWWRIVNTLSWSLDACFLRHLYKPLMYTDFGLVRHGATLWKTDSCFGAAVGAQLLQVAAQPPAPARQRLGAESQAEQTTRACLKTVENH